MMQTFGVDVGYGYTKAVSGDGRRLSFPSVVKATRQAGDLAKAFSGKTLQFRATIESGGQREHYLVGDAAWASDPVRSWDESAANRRDYDTLLLTALAALGARGPARVAIGLPLSVYASKVERRQVKMRLDGLAASVGLGGEAAAKIEIAQVSVHPQAVGAYFAAMAASPRYRGAALGLIDIGFRSTDYLLISSTMGSIVPEEDLSGSLDQGISQAYQRIASELSRRYGLGFPIPATHIESGLMEEAQEISVRRNRVALADPFDAECSRIGKEIGDAIRGVWAAKLEGLDAVLVGGGGGELLAGRLGIPAVELVPNPRFANAVGFAIQARRSAAV